jgi:hypothetical protein
MPDCRHGAEAGAGDDKILLVLLLGMPFGGLGLHATARAANLPVKAGGLVPVRRWSGCYLGGEYAFGTSRSVRAEYRHVDLGTTTVRLTDPARPGQYFDYGFKHRGDIVRVGLNYRFF